MKNRILRYFIFTLSLFTIGAITYVLYFKGYLQLNHPSKVKYPIFGIDVSHHQGVIDWKKVSDSGVSFVYIKATEGKSYKDNRFIYNWNEAQNNGLSVGAYHFFTFCKPGKQQAKNFLDSLPNQSIMLPPVIDFEFVGNCKNRPTKKEIIKEVKDWVFEVEKKTKCKPIFYITYEAYNMYLKGEIDEYKIWIRDVFLHPRYRSETPWILWQYYDKGQIEGIEGFVDFNIFNGNKNDFHSLTHCTL